MERNEKKVLAVNDLSSVGKCSLGVIIPILSAMKVEVYPVVTTVLSAHTGFDNPYIIDLTEHLDDIFTHIFAETEQFGFAYSGYLGSNHQMEIVKKHFARLKQKGAHVLVDPVLGDNGSLYSSFDANSVQAMAELCRNADIITPNYTEACFLAGIPYGDISSDGAREMAKQLSETLGVPSVVMTGIPLPEGKSIFILENGKTTEFPCDYVKGEYCGTGDAFSAVVCGCLARGEALLNAVKKAHRFVRNAIAETYRMGGTWKDGIMIEQFLDTLE